MNYFGRTLSAAGLGGLATLLSLAAAKAETTTICDQKIEYTLSPAAPGLPSEISGFAGRWQGMITYQPMVEMCNGFVFEKVDANGAVGQRAWSAGAGSGIVGVNSMGVVAYGGKFDGNILRTTSPDGKNVWEIRMTGPNEISGFFTRQGNRYPVWAKRK